MSGAKHMMEELEQQQSVAISIALETLVLNHCGLHDIVYGGDEDITDAYKLGNLKFSKGEFKDIFNDRKIMTDTIYAVVNDHTAEGCPICAKDRDED